MTRSLSPQQFGEYTLSYHPPDEDTPRHRIIAEHPEGIKYTRTPGSDKVEPLGFAGSMNWHPKSREVTSVHVQEEHRRKGVATAMWNMAQAASPKPRHSDDRTDAGDAWSKAVGGRRPARRKNLMRGDT